MAERYGYDAFGAPSIHNADATATLGQSAVGNSRLYTGRDYLPALGLYDPNTGRFLITDPIGSYADTNNLGNPYTYVGNNPGAFVDPFGLESWPQYFWSVYTEPVYALFGGNLEVLDRMQAHHQERTLARQRHEEANDPERVRARREAMREEKRQAHLLRMEKQREHNRDWYERNRRH